MADKEKTEITSEEIEVWQRGFRHHLAGTSNQPIGLVVDRAEGSWIYTPEGTRYLDLLSGIGVANIGHTHPEVVRAVDEQNRRHHHVMVYGEYVQESQARLAEELTRITPEGLDRVYFVNSGAEAVEGALKLARKATGRSRFVAFHGAYHGDTFGALSVGGNPIYQDPFPPLLEPVTLLPFGDVDPLGTIGRDVAAVIVEPVQGEGGVRVPPSDFLPALSQRCREVGALLILDEVMTGFGRTGRHFACQHWGVAPDLLVLAKALGGGYPLGAFVGTGPLLAVLAEDPPLSHVTTFGGHPVSCAAGRAALRVLRDQQLDVRAEALGRTLRRRLREVLLPPGGVREVRGMGLFVGVEFEDRAVTAAFARGCLDSGILLGWTLHHDEIIRLAPPLTIPEDILLEAVVRMGEVLSRVREGT